jgi:hypothetical protein
LDLKAQYTKVLLNRLAMLTLPAIAELEDGHFPQREVRYLVSGVQGKQVKVA